jgi:ubiquinone biosynthesis accessory factor UbiJ
MLEILINQALALDEVAQQSMAKLAGKTLLIQIEGTPLKWYFAPQIDGFLQMPQTVEFPDAVVSGMPFSLLRLLSEPTLLTTGIATLSGEMKVAQSFMTVFAQLQIDWEEQFSHVVGDVAAHQMGNFTRNAQQYTQQTVQTWQQNIVEYLQEENRFLPTQPELELFYNEVDTVRSDVARLEKRLERLLMKSPTH